MRMRMPIKRSLAVLTSAVFMVVIGAVAAAPAQAADTCVGKYRIQASNGYYVSAEEGLSQYNGMLRARTPASALGTWEEFRVREITGAPGIVSFAFQAHNGKYVDTWWNSYSGSVKGMLRASASGYGSNDQRFRFPYNAISEGNPHTITSALNNLLVTNEEGYTGSQWGMLRARTSPSSAGSWEQFTFHRIGNC